MDFEGKVYQYKLYVMSYIANYKLEGEKNIQII